MRVWKIELELKDYPGKDGAGEPYRYLTKKQVREIFTQINLDFGLRVRSVKATRLHEEQT